VGSSTETDEWETNFMPDPNERDAKLIQYLSEAYGKERELETALQVDIAITTKAPYKKRLQQHLKETKAHAKALDRRIRKLGGGGQTVASLVGKATAVAKGPLHAVRGDGQQERMLKNAKTQFTSEQEEISTYLALEIFAKKVGDTETAKLAGDIRREEERMAKFLDGQIRQLAGATALEEVPARLRRSATSKKRTAKKAAATKPTAAAKPKTATKKTAKKSTAKKSTAKKSRAKSKAKS
jgi:ferritin-like metal-binding protein YciE